MDSLTAILIVALVLRVLLDLASIKANTKAFQWVYVCLFFGIGVLLLLQNYEDIFGYLSIALGIIWVAGLVSRSKKDSKE